MHTDALNKMLSLSSCRICCGNIKSGGFITHNYELVYNAQAAKLFLKTMYWNYFLIKLSEMTYIVTFCPTKRLY